MSFCATRVILIPMLSLSFIFKVRWVLWTVGVALVLTWYSLRRGKPNLFLRYFERFIPGQLRAVCAPSLDRTPIDRTPIENVSPSENNNSALQKTHVPYFKSLTILCGGFFCFALLGKFSQLWTLNLNAQDFWLFVDQLEQAKKGGFFLTRFAPQALGFVQHGTVHPMLTWGLMVAPAWILGSTGAALLFNPLVLAGAGWMIALLARKRWGDLGSLIFAAAFLASTQVGKILNYDVHPEAAYPFLTLLWFWSLGFDTPSVSRSNLAALATSVSQSDLAAASRPVSQTDSEAVSLYQSPRVRWSALLLSTVLCMGTKEDAFLVLGPWMVWGIFKLKSTQRYAVVVSALVAFCVIAVQCLAVQNWLTGSWGPALWKGTPVVTRGSVQAFAGQHWTGFQDIFRMGTALLASQGGVGGSLLKVGKFLVSQPWLSILVLVPWVVGSLRFWWVILPLACVHAWIEGPNHLWNYYSAPFLGSLWFSAVGVGGWKTSRDNSTPKVAFRKATTQGANFRPHWSLLAALLLGSSSIQFFIPSHAVREIRREAQLFLPCLGNNGLVASHLIGLVPLEKIVTDRIPPTPAPEWARLDFVLLSPQLDLFGMPSPESKKLSSRLSEAKSGFNRIGSCAGNLIDGDQVELFVRSTSNQTNTF